MAESLADALASLRLIEASHEGIDVLSVVPNEELDVDGQLVDTLQVSYSIIGRPGVYTVSVPYEDNWTAIAFYYIGVQAHDIELIYEGAPDRNRVPTVLLVTPPPPPPTPSPRPGPRVPA